MKKIITLMTVTLGLSLAGLAQEVPSIITDAFKIKYPNAEDCTWEMNENKNWESEFMFKDTEYSVTYSNTGEWLRSEYRISTSELPENIMDQLKKDFIDFEVAEVEQVESGEGKGYEIDLYDGDQEIEVEFNSTGKLIAKKVTSESDDEMDDE